MTSPDPNVPEGFPDLFIYTLRDVLEPVLTADPDFPSQPFLFRPVRPTDPTRSMAVVEGDTTPAASEIGMNEPSILSWQAVIQVFVKHSNEVEGRNIRRRLIQRVRKTLFLPSTVQALMTLNDGYDRVSKFRLQRIDWSATEARDANKQFFFLGQVELVFQTEKL